jgi:DNA repair exonuclease SbcCD nuclease subunit
MPIRILHTADNHIGLSFIKYPDPVRERLVNERFQALKRLVDTANQRKAHFFVVAGDLFDRIKIPEKDIRRTVELLKAFEGEAVLVLAGNHDYCEGQDSKLWKEFRKAAEGTPVLALTAQETKDFTLDEGSVRFYACPCPSKYSAQPVTGCVADAEKPEGMLHVGLAHGNVEGLGLDADQRYFNMRESDLRAVGLHTWLLGHIHVPAPEPGTTGRPTYFMPGTHTPDSVKCKHPGHAWWLELEAGGGIRHEQLTTGELRFVRLDALLQHANDLEALRQRCAPLDAPNTVLDLRLTGRLKAEELQDLNALVNELSLRFLHVEREQDVASVLEAGAIAERFPEGTLPHTLLTDLLADSEHPGDAQVAFELIKELAKQ